MQVAGPKGTSDQRKPRKDREAPTDSTDTFREFQKKVSAGGIFPGSYWFAHQKGRILSALRKREYLLAIDLGQGGLQKAAKTSGAVLVDFRKFLKEIDLAESEHNGRPSEREAEARRAYGAVGAQIDSASSFREFQKEVSAGGMFSGASPAQQVVNLKARVIGAAARGEYLKAKDLGQRGLEQAAKVSEPVLRDFRKVLEQIEPVKKEHSGERTTLAPSTGRLKIAGLDAEAKQYVFRREGDFWEVVFGEESAPPIPHLKGMKYLAVLLREAFDEVHPVEIPIKAGEGLRADKTKEALDAELNMSGEGDAGETVDAIALKEYSDRLTEIEDELLPKAREENDEARVGRFVKEKEFILEHIKKSINKYGRPRKFEKRRKNERDRVLNNIETALNSLHEKIPALADHLRESIERGSTRSYRPEPPVDWNVSF